MAGQLAAVGEGESIEWDPVSQSELRATMQQAEAAAGFARPMSPQRERRLEASKAQLKALDHKLLEKDAALESARRKVRAASPDPPTGAEAAYDVEAAAKRAYDA